MDPRALLRPVGPEPAGVYWRRRAGLLAASAVVAAAGWGLAAAAGSGSPAHPAGPSPRPTTPAPSVSSTSSTRPTGVRACRRSDLRVTAATDAATYPSGVLPHLSATLTNVGDRPCRYNSSPSAHNWTILSGSDRIWSTTDCPQSHLVATAVLRRGRSVSYHTQWDRHRSTAGCATPGAAALPGTYRLYVTIDGITSAAAVFHLS